MILLYRKEIDVTNYATDVFFRFQLGPLRARIGFLPIPVRFAKWWLGI